MKLGRALMGANSRFPFLLLLNTTTMILCGKSFDNFITRPKSMLVVVFRIRNKGNRPFRATVQK